ncbi:ATP-binding protein [Mycobacterium cookii]|uniref:Sulfate transporter n=1 Tax=Mycobacterium cookii TaxID=1775 RepID=A0A7I7KW14_9MYCO|nr:STAS domain-containing protein [Mycobacterium cookii]MCV7332867.1 sulfate transporter [Mycobacterium cookii]BBX46255.1 sulfate transporter [Mycobacterium cookii]
MSRPASRVAVEVDTAGDTCLLTVNGVLDSSTYPTLRDAVIKAALDAPRAVLVDVNGLDVPASSAWSVFTSARWHVSTWPDVPIMLVCAHSGRRATIARSGVTRYVPVYAAVESARRAVVDDARPVRHRCRSELPASTASVGMARDLVTDQLTAWSQAGLISVAMVVVNVLVDNVLQHTVSAPVVILESEGPLVTISVQDNSSTPAARREDAFRGGDQVSGLAIMAAISRAWGSTPTPSGKTVWAVIGPENRLRHAHRE